MEKYYLAIDIGASSGRHILGCVKGGKTEYNEVYRFENGVKKTGVNLVWDTEHILAEVKEGIRRAFKLVGNIVSLAVDTWGVDYVLMSRREEKLPCISYRDAVGQALIDRVHARIPFEKLYGLTGIQFQKFNTIYRLYDDIISGKAEGAENFLMMPEYLNYKLTGIVKKEYTNATTTGLVNAYTCDWDADIIELLNLDKKLFGRLYKPGESVGMLLPSVAEEVGGQTEVVLCASHDTASAVEGMDIDGNMPYISSGTWSLLGIKSAKAHADAESMRENWSNEGGAGYIRYQKNIMGMWVVNELRRELCPGSSFNEIIEDVRRSTFEGVADINDARFLAPESMKSAFDGAFAGTSNGPRNRGDYFNCAFLSLAQSYERSLRELEKNTGIKCDKLYIAGGGAKNEYLNELTERACNVKLVVRPDEVTAAGNIKVQAERVDRKENKAR